MTPKTLHHQTGQQTTESKSKDSGAIREILLDGIGADPAREPALFLEQNQIIQDLCSEPVFIPQLEGASSGPYDLMIARGSGNSLVMSLTCTQSAWKGQINLPLSGLKGLLGDYAIICDNFYKTVRQGDLHRLEALDEGRRGLHDEAAEMLADTLSRQLKLDKAAARRLFSLIYVLHRGAGALI